uniref:Pyridoxal phosphate homeostasis protein n=1 Tax=Homalodisca liturata TaxID=320908 RepID=A0A1B6HFI3_9HEMI
MYFFLMYYLILSCGVADYLCHEGVESGLKDINKKIFLAAENRSKHLPNIKPRLVAVSKTKPKELIFAAYDYGQRHFGENYIQELVEKSNDPEVLEKCKDIKWHFIGNLQSNKIKKIVAVPGIFVVETVDTEKLATMLDNAWSKQEKPNKEKLNVMVQINTSGEEAKNGAEPAKAVPLSKHVVENCPNLQLMGLMTIGRFDHDLTKGPNPDFQVLLQCREDVCKALNKRPEDLELSMGMSNDFEHAIEVGSTNVRVGTSIFGAREYKKPATKPEDSVTEHLAQTSIS